MSPRDSSSPPAIDARDVAIRYRGSRLPALRRVSFQAARGELVLVMGATGSGKSTLIKALARIVPCLQPADVWGEIALFGQPVHRQAVRDLAGTVGVIFQDFEAQLFSTNVLCEAAFAMEQLGVPPVDMPARAAGALAAVGLAGFGERDPTTLSGGEKQRLAIAGLLALEPSLLLLDEPTTDLDPAGTIEVLELLEALKDRGRTVVVVEHELAAAAVADRVVLLQQGEIVASGAPRELLSQVALFEECGVRPHDFARLYQQLEMAPPLAPGGWLDHVTGEHAHEAAQQALVAAGFTAAADGRVDDSDTDVPPPAGPVRVAMQGVTYEYRGGKRALDGVSLTLRAREFVALIGQNGSGKTTLAKHLNGLLVPTSGVVLLDGVDLRDIPPHRVACEVGFVFQDPDHQLFAATAAEEVAFGPGNLGLPADEVERRTRQALAAVGLSHRQHADPFLLDKGDRQRLAVASVLAMRPSILILDEPTTGLDYREQRQMMALLQQLNAEGTAVVVITHSPWMVAEYASRAVLMTGGRVLWDGSLRRMFAQPELLRHAAFRPPEITALGRRFGVTPLSVDELAHHLAGRASR